MKHVILLSVLLSIVSACWPTAFMNPKDNSYPEEWEAFYVLPIEVNTATAPSNYGAILSENLRTGIQNNTKLKLASTSNDAQVKISGNVINYFTAPTAIQQNDQVSQNRLTVSVHFTISSPTKGLEEMTMTSTRFVDYNVNEQLSAVEARLIEEINQQVVQDVINKLQSNW